MQVFGYPLTNMGTNCYLVTEEKTKDAVLFDPAGFSQQIADYIKSNDLELHYVVLTHGHSDHIGGVNGFMKEFPDAKLVAGAKELPMLQSSKENMTAMMYGEEIELTPDILAKDGDTLIAGSLELKILETPGHTLGGISVVIEDAVFSGDTLFRESIGRTDFEGGDFATIMDSIKNKLFKLPDNTKVYPGHMGPTEIGHEKRHNPFV